MGQPPARVKRHAEAVDRFPEQQRFKAHLGGDGINRLYAIQQGVGMAVFGHYLHVVQRQPRQHAAFFTQPGIRVSTQQQAGIGVITAGRRHHCDKILFACQRTRNGEIPCHLVNQQHFRARVAMQAGRQRIRQAAICGIAVVLGDAETQQFSCERFGTRQHAVIAGGRDQLFKAARLAGIVVNSHRIGDQGDGFAPPGGMANIPDKAILKLPVRQA